MKIIRGEAKSNNEEESRMLGISKSSKNEQLRKEDCGWSAKKRNKKNKIETIKNNKGEELWKLQRWQRGEIGKSKNCLIKNKNYYVKNTSWKEEERNNSK
jgi:hypothetical protein